MVQTLVTLLLRLAAFLLVNYGLASTDVAVMLTSDPDLVAMLTSLVAGGVVLVSETLARYIGAGPVKIVLAVAQRYLSKVSDKFILRK